MRRRYSKLVEPRVYEKLAEPRECEELHSEKDYTLACCSYLRKIMHRLSFVAVLLALVLAVNVLALFGDALIRSLIEMIGGAV